MSASGESRKRLRARLDGRELTGAEVAAAILRPILAGVILLVGYFLLPLNASSDYNLAGFICGALLLLTFCGWEIHRFARTTRPVETALEMLVAVASLYIVTFASTYFMFSEYMHGSFNERLTRVDALYFSLTVFTTTGFGDINAVAQPARIAVSVQMVSTFVLLGLGIRFLSLLVNVKRKRRDERER